MKRTSPSTSKSARVLVAAGFLLACASCSPRPVVKMLPTPRVELSPAPRVPAAPCPVVALPAPTHPTVSIRIAFRAGAVDDPPGREGLTALTASLMAEGGTEKQSSAQIQRALYPMAAGLGAATDEEMTVFEGQVHKDHLAGFLPILIDVITHPRWDQTEFERLREDAVNDIERRLRTSDDENLGKAALESLIYEGHPYAHYAGGTVSALRAVTVSELKAHAAKVFTRKRLIIGIAGGYPASVPDALQAAFASLPEGDRDASISTPPPDQKGPRVLIVEKPTDSIAVSLGAPWLLGRGDPDYPAMRVALSAFGEHRQFNGRLMNHLREVRGLNYGDYAYIESFVEDQGTTYPEPNIPRASQLFSIWLRPVEAKNGVFALRAALYETEKLVRGGLTSDEVERTKKFLAGYTMLFTQTDARRLGYAIDDLHYRTPDHQKTLRTRMATLTQSEVNAAVKKWIEPSRLRIAIVARDGAALKKALLDGAPSPIHYNSAVPAAILAEDKLIEAFPLHLKDEDIRVVKASELFER